VNKQAAAEVELRVDRLARLLISGARTSECVRYSSETWGVTRRQSETYIARARKLIREDMSMERQDFLAQKLALMDDVAKKALNSNQLGAAIGAARLAAELAQLL
jgi:hypothetical protein